jgi:dihydrofolate synthase / folylpolyglutamate synthase
MSVHKIPVLHTLDDVMQAFLAYAPVSMDGNYQLDRMRSLLDCLGNPQEQLRVVHIAGTSGKTSTAYFVRGMLEAAGRRTGLTVSPHISSFNERVQIDGVPLAEDRFVKYAHTFLEIVGQSGIEPTYFELAVGLAYWVFAREAVDYAVIETGLGGLYDGTNTVRRADKLCVITDIGLDHTEILGDTVAEIAAQKAGIIQPGNHVFAGRQADEITTVISRTARSQRATLHVVPDSSVPDELPAFQRHNWQLAAAVFAHIQQVDGLPVVPSVTYQAVAGQTPPGRWEVYERGGKTIILDGAHNPQKLQALYESLQARQIPATAVLANLVAAPEAKIRQSLAVIALFTTHLIVPEFNSGQDLKSRRSLPAADCAAYAAEASLNMADIVVQPDTQQALDALLARPEQTVVVTGSLYLVSAVRRLLLE